MLATIIVDTYKQAETMEIINALDALCSPNDNIGWASAGIYCFWNYYTKEILYIGLAVDFMKRFKQHNGLLPADPRSCKWEYIQDYFLKQDKLGYTIMVQSTMSQPQTSSNKLPELDGETIYELGIDPFAQTGLKRNAEDREDIINVEGILLECYKREHRTLPKWNRVGGCTEARDWVQPGNYRQILKSFTKIEPHILVSRSTLRELATNPTFERYEGFLHSVRVLMLRAAVDVDVALKLALGCDILGTYKEMVEAGYLERNLPL